MDAVAEGTIAEADVPSLLLVVAVWVNPDAGDEQAVFSNNREATLAALRAGREGRPEVAAALRAPTFAFQRLLSPMSGTVGRCRPSAWTR